MRRVERIRMICRCGIEFHKRPKSAIRFCSKRCGNKFRRTLPPNITRSRKLLRMKKWRSDNRELALRLTKEWRSRNKERLSAYAKRWRLLNSDRHRIAKNKWNRKHPEKARERVKKWKKSNPDKVAYNHNKRRAQCSGSCPLTRKVYGRCLELKQWFDVVVDHIIPLSKGGRHSFQNLQIIYAHENSVKNDSLNYVPRIIFT